MGHNTLLTIKGADLDRIANDPKFGARLAGAVSASSMIPNYNELERDGFTIRPSACPRVGVVNTEDLEENAAYSFHVGISQHADLPQVYALQDGAPVSLSHSGPKDWEACITLAETLADAGHVVQNKSYGVIVKARQTGAFNAADEALRMGGFSKDALENAGISFIILNDGLSQISQSETLGSDIASSVREFWKCLKWINTETQRGDLTVGGYPSEDISCGNFANAISIAGIHPEGARDVIKISGNWGRVIQGNPSTLEMAKRNLSKSREKLLADIHDRDMKVLREALKDAGFMVRQPGRKRSESASFWNEDNFARPPEDTPLEPGI